MTIHFIESNLGIWAAAANSYTLCWRQDHCTHHEAGRKLDIPVLSISSFWTSSALLLFHCQGLLTNNLELSPPSTCICSRTHDQHLAVHLASLCIAYTFRASRKVLISFIASKYLAVISCHFIVTYQASSLVLGYNSLWTTLILRVAISYLTSSCQLLSMRVSSMPCARHSSH